jgi:hypothetical protein
MVLGGAGHCFQFPGLINVAVHQHGLHVGTRIFCLHSHYS